MKKKTKFFEIGEIDYDENITDIAIPSIDEIPVYHRNSNYTRFKYDGKTYYFTGCFHMVDSNFGHLFWASSLKILFQEFYLRFGIKKLETVGSLIKRVNPKCDRMNGESYIYKHYTHQVHAFYCIDNVFTIFIYSTSQNNIKLASFSRTVYGYQVYVSCHKNQLTEFMNILNADKPALIMKPTQEITKKLAAQMI